MFYPWPSQLESLRLVLVPAGFLQEVLSVDLRTNGAGAG
jgi:hypothetical protein